MTWQLDTSKCMHCGMCVSSCPFGALVMRDFPENNPSLCKSCGACQQMCPNKAIQVKK